MDNAKELIDRVTADVQDIMDTDFEFNHITVVPHVDDQGLTYENGDTKKGEEINTCVLYVDIRNSVALMEESQTKTMGRIYTGFTKAMLKAADKCNGRVRNIIGDRVMIVFPEENCFKNAVECAITINHLAKKVINNKIANHTFECGIGVDYGRMRCIKVGVKKPGPENREYKNLVWIGKPANYASRLTDFANKEMDTSKYVLTAEYVNFSLSGLAPSLGLFGNVPTGPVNKTRRLTETELVKELLSPSLRKVSNIEKEPSTHRYYPILVSKQVYDGFCRECPNDKSVQKGWWHKEIEKIKDVTFDVYGCDLHWDV